MGASTPHFKVLDSWRGVCACMVALLHLMVNSHIYPIPVIKSAGFFVDFFFVLSGFVIFANYEEKLRKGYSVLKYMVLRFGRLYPLHFAILMVFILSDIVQVYIPSLSQYAQFAPFTAPGETWGDIISQLFLFHALDTEHVKAFNTPSWSISAEFYTYIVFAIATLVFRTRILHFCIFSATVFSIVLMYIFTDHTDYMFIEGFLRCLAGFAAGGLCWFLYKSKLHNNLRLFSAKAIWTTAELMMLVVIYLFIAYTAGTVYQYFAPVVFGLVILIYSLESGVVSDLLKRKFFLFLGMLSYSIYMVHAFIASKVFPLAAKLIEKYTDIRLFAMVDGREKIGVELWHGDLITIFYLMVVITTSYITFKLIEAPARTLSRHIVNTQRTRPKIYRAQDS